MIDEMDRRIMLELQQDGRSSYREIAKKLGVAAGTVRTRLLQLMRDNVLKVIAVPNPWAMGYGFHGTVALRLQAGYAAQVADTLAAREDVGWVGLMWGGYDLMFEITLANSRSFGQFKEEVLAALPGCLHVDVFEVYDIRKFNYRLHPSEGRYSGQMDTSSMSASDPSAEERVS